MVLYFSGTGNSRYAAEAIGLVVDDRVVSINDLVKNGSKEIFRSDVPFVFVCPTYAWRVPRIVDAFIREAHFEGNRKAYFILTCGTDTGNAAHYVKRACLDKGLDFMGLASVVMPENYIAMYDAPDKTQAEAIIQKAIPHILDIARHIKNNQPLLHETVVPGARLKSGVVNPIFYSAIVSAKGFYSTEACIACGKCTELCPLNNIKIENNKPHWGSNCTHCMACICSCPKEAIEYKNKSKGKARYYNTEEPMI